jgi:DNA-binding transcriptional LysR family regulator
VRVGRLPDSRLIATHVGVVQRVVCASPGYLAGHGSPKTPEDLAEHVGVTFESLPGGPPWAFAAAGGGLTEAAVRSRLTVNSAEAAVDAAVAGLGLAHVLSYQAAPALRAGGLRRLLRDAEPAGLPIHLVHGGQGALPLKTRGFLDFAVPRLRGSLATLLADDDGPAPGAGLSPS